MTSNDKASDHSLTEEATAQDMPLMTNRANIVVLHPLAPADYYATAIMLDRYAPNDQRVAFWRREAGREWTGYPEGLADSYREFATERWYAANDRARQFASDQQRLRERRERHVPTNNELGPREFTFTFSQGKHFPDDETAKAAMTTALERLTKYYKEEIIEFHAVGEYTAAGRPHIHGWYHLSGGRKITDKNFRRAYPPWNPKRKLGRGFEGGHHQTIVRQSDFHGYTEKHLEEAWIVVDIPNADDNPPQAPA